MQWTNKLSCLLKMRIQLPRAGQSPVKKHFRKTPIQLLCDSSPLAECGRQRLTAYFSFREEGNQDTEVFGFGP